MHIFDGILSIYFLLFGWVISILILYYIINNFIYNKSNLLINLIPKISLFTATFFVVSLISIPIGFTSIHLMFIGPISIILGPVSYISIFISLILQSIFLHSGGLLSLGINSFIMGGASVLNYYLYTILRKYLYFSYAGCFSTFISLIFFTIIHYLILYINGNFYNLNFKYFIQLHAIPMIVTVIIESIITVFILKFLYNIKSNLFFEFK